MKKNGFTLIELLAVIVLLVILLSVIYPSVSKVIDKGKDVTYQSQIDKIISATYDWSLKNVSKLPESGEAIYVTLAELKKDGFIEANIKNPNTNELFPDGLLINIINVGRDISKEDIDTNSKVYGDYLYSINESSISTYSGEASIVLNGLNKNSSGDYVTNIDLNSVFDNNDYVATSSRGADITDKVVVNILYNDAAVEKVDTSKTGIYYIKYTVVDEFGKVASATRNVIISDISAPTISLPEEREIGLDVREYDLMNGVSCSDNSGNCDITTSGNIEFGTPGKYIIEYTAKDFSGNTSSVKRVITVK